MEVNHNFPCVILAGGKSSRMEEDKSLLPFGNFDTLIEYQYNKLSKIFSEVYISSKINKFNFTNNLILDNSNVYSPMIALQAILNKFNHKVFIITVDIPLVYEESITELIINSNNHDITIATTKDRTHNLCGVFCRNLLKRIDDLIKKDIHKINFLIKNSNTSYISFNDEEQFININTPNDYKKAMDTYKKY